MANYGPIKVLIPVTESRAIDASLQPISTAKKLFFPFIIWVQIIACNFNQVHHVVTQKHVVIQPKTPEITNHFLGKKAKRPPFPE